MTKFKTGNRVQEKYRPFNIGTVFKVEEGSEQKRTIYYIRMKGGSTQITTGDSFKMLK